MNVDERTLILDVFDYEGNKLCSLYDNSSDISGHATNVIVTTERNGWKSLSFLIPSTCQTENGEQENYRLQYLNGDYRIRMIEDVVDEDGNPVPDWFYISEPKITHVAFSKNIQVTADHISQLLKTKNLGLEFSDEEGNNVGTAEELLETILEGTGWKVGYVYPFAQKDGSTKYRSMKASAKTGAFKLISNMCDLFDAKPVYHGHDRSVDIIPVNPFSDPDEDNFKSISEAGVIELHYGKNIKNVTRTLNTQNLITRLYAYGSYGDITSGYCGIDEASHDEYVFTMNGLEAGGQKFYFTVTEKDGVETSYYFVMQNPNRGNDRLIFSMYDPASRLYIWDEHNQTAYPVFKGDEGEALPASLEVVQVKNWFTSVMNFDYYRKQGMLSDEMIKKIAAYQVAIHEQNQVIYEKSLEMSEAVQQVTSIVGGKVQFCRLDIAEAERTEDGCLKLTLNKETYPDGIIYRTDGDKKKKNQFKWRVTQSIDHRGDPKNPAAAIVYVIKPSVSGEIKWQTAYLKGVDDEDDPSVIVLHIDPSTFELDLNEDQFFLFEQNDINGYLGVLQSNTQAAMEALDSATKIVTEPHTTYFVKSNEIPASAPVDRLNGYGWLWCTDGMTSHRTKMYFCFGDENDTTWKPVYFTDALSNEQKQAAPVGSYWYDWKKAVLYRCSGKGPGMFDISWTLLDLYSQKKVAALFGTVYRYCCERDKLYDGIYADYIFTRSSSATAIPKGNYFIQNEYHTFWCFTTTEDLSAMDDKVSFNTTDRWVTQTVAGVDESLQAKEYRFDNVKYHPTNLLEGVIYENGTIENGSEKDSTTMKRSGQFIPVYPDTTYDASGITGGATIHFYNENQMWLSSTTYSGTSFTFKTDRVHQGSIDNPVALIKIVGRSIATASNAKIAARNAENSIVIKDVTYNKLSPVTHSSGIPIKGIVPYMNLFVEQANKAYIDCDKALKAAQKVAQDAENDMTVSLGDLFREGYWQKDDYVDGDEQKLYADALDNLEKVSKPEAKYTIDYLDLYDSDKVDKDYCSSDLTADVPWPDIQITSAAHLVDPQIDVNVWAFIDKIKKCYDQPWKTSIEINTDLSLIGQHSFTDVMTHIAEVASGVKSVTARVVSAPSSSVTQTTVIADGVIAGSNIAAETITGDNIANNTISIDKIYNFEDAVISAATALIGDARINAAQIKDLTAQIAKIVEANIDVANIKTADIKDLNTEVLNAVKANIDSLTTDEVHSDLLEAIVAKLLNADITNAKINYAQISTIDGSQAMFKTLQSGQIYADHLTVKNLMMPGEDGKLVQIAVEDVGEGDDAHQEVVVKEVGNIEGTFMKEDSMPVNTINIDSITSDSPFTIAIGNKIKPSNGYNVLQGSSQNDQTFENTLDTDIVIGQIDLPASFPDDTYMTMRAHLAPTLGNWKVLLYARDADDGDAYEPRLLGNEVAAGQEDWSQTTIKLTRNASKVYAVLRNVSGGTGTIAYHSAKVEFGMSATEWSEAIEDTERAIRDQITIETNARVQTLEDRIIQEATERTASFDSLQTRTTSLQTTANGLSVTLSETAESLRNGIDSTTDALNSYKNEVSSYLSYTRNEDGIGTLTLGTNAKGNEDFKTQITNTEMAFVQGEDKVAYISNKSLYITQARVTDTLSIGTDEDGYFDWVVTPTGLGLKWRNIQR